MERCDLCDVTGAEVRLYDAILEGRPSTLCERCSIIENIPIIKTPNPGQLKEAERGEKVVSRMRRLTGLQQSKKQETFFREDKLKELEKNPELEKPQQKKLNLLPHFHWEIMKNRKEGKHSKEFAKIV